VKQDHPENSVFPTTETVSVIALERNSISRTDLGKEETRKRDINQYTLVKCFAKNPANETIPIKAVRFPKPDP